MMKREEGERWADEGISLRDECIRELESARVEITPERALLLSAMTHGVLSFAYWIADGKPKDRLAYLIHATDLAGAATAALEASAFPERVQ